MTELDEAAVLAAFNANHNPLAEPSSLELDKMRKSIRAYRAAMPLGVSEDYEASRAAGQWEDAHRELLNAIMACCDPAMKVCGMHPGPERLELEAVIARQHTIHKAEGPYIGALSAAPAPVSGDGKALDSDLLEDFRDDCEGEGVKSFPKSNVRKLIAEIDRLRGEAKGEPVAWREAFLDFMADAKKWHTEPMSWPTAAL